MATPQILAKATLIGQSMASAALERRKLAEASRKKALESSATIVITTTVEVARQDSVDYELLKKASVGVLIAEGDSWFDYPLSDVLKELDDEHGFDVMSVAHHGDDIEEMAYAYQLDDFVREAHKLAKSGGKPRAILISGGGNDFAGDEFETMLNHAESPVPGLNQDVVKGMLDERIPQAYAVIISAITHACETLFGVAVPILIHGYDYPVPDGRGFLWYGPWLEPGFKRKGYKTMESRKPLIEELINRFNTMLANIPSRPGCSHVKYVDLRRTLSTDPKTYKLDWDNEMHPTPDGFRAVTKKFVAAL